MLFYAEVGPAKNIDRQMAIMRVTKPLERRALGIFTCGGCFDLIAEVLDVIKPTVVPSGVQLTSVVTGVILNLFFTILAR